MHLFEYLKLLKKLFAYLANVCDFSAYSRTSPSSDAGAESDELLFPIEEVTESAGNAKSSAYMRTSNMT